MLINSKLNDKSQKMMWAEAVHTFQLIRNNIDNTGSIKRTFINLYKKKPKIIGLFSYFGRIVFVTKQDKFKKQMTDKTFKAIMVGYANNHTRDTYKLYNLETKRVIMPRDIKWEEWKMNDSEETLKMF